MINKKIIKLKNGIIILIIPLNTILTDVSVNILLGSKNETKYHMEITHYIEHLIARFTSKKYSNYKFIANELHKRAAVSNASVSDYETKFFIRGYYNDIEFFLDLLSNTMNNLLLEKSIMKQEKNAVIQELKNLMSDYYYLFNLKIDRYLNRKYSYQNDYNKHIKNMKRFNENNIYKYFKSHVILKNTVISIVCPKKSINKTIKLAKKYFNFKIKNKLRKLKYPDQIYNNKKLKILYIKNYNKNNNTYLKIIVNQKIKYLSKQYIILQYLKEILFNFDTGIFYKELRDKYGLIYSISMNINIDMINSKFSSYSIETNIKDIKLPKLISIILDIIENIKITKDEFKAIKNLFNINFELEKFQNLTSNSNYYTNFLLYKMPIISKEKLKYHYNQINYNDILNMLKIFKKNVLTNGLIFYYSKNNMNNDIKKIVDKKIQYIIL